MIRKLLPGAVVTLLLFVIRFGYDWGVSDQDEFLPYLAHLLDPALFTTDWFVQGQISTYSVRSSFVFVLKAVASTGLGPLGAVHVVYVLSFLGLALAVGSITSSIATSSLSPSSWAGVLSMPLALVVTARWNPGGNDAAYGMLVPEMPAWTLVFMAAAILLHLRPMERRPALLAGVLLGAAVLLHPLAGLQAGALLIVWMWWVRTENVRYANIVTVLWLMVAIPVVWTVMSSGTSQSYDSRVILTTLRAPHHYLPGAFSLGATMRFLFLAGLAGFTLWRLPGAFRSGTIRTQIAWLLGIGMSVHAVSWLFVAIAPDGFHVALQPFKLTVFTRILSASIISAGIFHVAGKAGARVNRRVSGRAVAWSIGAAIPVMIVLMATVPSVQFRALPALSPERDAFNVRADRVRQSVAPVDIVMIPPDWTGFQFASGRAQFVSFKAYPFVDSLAEEWKRRLELVGVASSTERTGTAWLAASATAYRMRTDPEWRVLLPSLRATHALLPATTGIEPKLFCDAEWCLVDARAILPP